MGKLKKVMDSCVSLWVETRKEIEDTKLDKLREPLRRDIMKEYRHRVK